MGGLLGGRFALGALFFDFFDYLLDGVDDCGEEVFGLNRTIPVLTHSAQIMIRIHE